MMAEFTLLNVADRARRARFSLPRGATTSTKTAVAAAAAVAASVATTRFCMETPAFLCETRRAAPHHLTGHLLSDLDGIVGMQIPLPDIWSVIGLDVMKKYGKGLAQFANLSAYMLFSSTTDPNNVPPDSYNENGRVSVFSKAGRAKVTAEDFMDFHIACGTHVVSSLCDMQTTFCGVSRQRKSVDRSLKYLDVCLEKLKDHGSESQVMFGSIVGGSSQQLREISAEETVKRDVAGFLIEGINTGEGPEETIRIIQTVVAKLPDKKPRICLGFGTPADVLNAISEGVDIFDSIYPVATADAGNAIVFGFASSHSTSPLKGMQQMSINLWESSYKDDFEPLLPGCECFACKSHTRAYIHHLLVVHEMLAFVLLMHHNYHHYSLFFKAIRETISDGSFSNYSKQFHNAYT